MKNVGAACDEIRLMIYNVNPDVMDVCLKKYFRQVMKLV